MGVIAPEARVQQTIRGLQTIRKNVSDAIIFLVDGSPRKVEDEKIQSISNYVDFMVYFSGDETISTFAKNHKKSEAECALLIKTLLLLKQDPKMINMMQSVTRIFKVSGRTDLVDSFDINEHNHPGKYVFKTRIPTWLRDSRKQYATDLLITRLYSLCPSLIEDYIKISV